jgi:hypothetical protein
VARFCHFVRKATRLTAASLFWLNALFIVVIPHAPFHQVEIKTGLTPSELCLAGFFVSLALLGFYGFSKFLVDVVYVYAFPFVIVYYGFKWLLKLIWKTAKVIAAIAPPPAQNWDWQDISKLLPGQRIVSNPISPPSSAAQNPSEKSPANKPRRSWKRRAWDGLKLPVACFTSAWCILIAVTDKPVFLICALLVLAVHCIRFLVIIAATAVTVNKVFAGVEEKLTTFTRNLIGKILLVPLDSSPDQELTKVVAQLVGIRFASFFLLKRNEIVYGVLTIASLAYLFVYLRLVVLFAFLYLGVAKLQGIHFTLLDSAFVALFMPLTYGDLPRNYFLKGIAGVQSLMFLLMGFGVIKTYLDRRVEAVKQAASLLWEKLNEADVRSRIDHFSAQQAPTSVPPAT